jgi:hypothetical protein
MKHTVPFLVATVLITGAFLLDPIAQDPAYHLFADTRQFLGIANFWNVVSNILFLYAGIRGLQYLAAGDTRGILHSLRPAYRVFFTGVLLTAFGSAWYHSAPTLDSMVWDRLPMTLVFMSLFSIVLGEHVSESFGRQILLPLMLAGAGSVVYWSLTEGRGAGDLRPYVLVQFLPMMLIPLILMLYASCFDRTGFFWGVIGIYAAAKLFELFDSDIYLAGELISGHSIKHLVAGLAALLFLRGLKSRRAKQPVPQGYDHEH